MDRDPRMEQVREALARMKKRPVTGDQDDECRECKAFIAADEAAYIGPRGSVYCRTCVEDATPLEALERDQKERRWPVVPSRKRGLSRWT